MKVPARALRSISMEHPHNIPILILHRMRHLFALLALLIGCQTTQASPVWEAKENELVALLGDTFWERDYHGAAIETALTVATAGKKVRFRNLGWSGDTPRCESRSYFGPPREGFDRLKQQLAEIKPTTVMICYGAVDSFTGEAGLASFLQAYREMLQMIRETTQANIVLFSPPPASRDTKRWPSLAAQSAQREMYARAIEKLATEEKLAFADLHALMKDQAWTTVNGVTFTQQDYKQIAPLVVRSLGLSIDPTTLAQPSLRETIIAKNQLFFQRWRPQNEIYLFGSRKHEQGNNGVEIPQFDPLIAEKEALIFSSFANSNTPDQ